MCVGRVREGRCVRVKGGDGRRKEMQQGKGLGDLRPDRDSRTDNNIQQPANSSSRGCFPLSRVSCSSSAEGD